jgi:acyl-CoA-binding protein
MAAKKIIGRDAMGNPIYEGGRLPSSPGAGSGVGAGTSRTAPKSPAKPKTSTAPKPSVGTISSKDAPRNLQGAPQNTARKIIGMGAAPKVPTVPELEAIRNKAAGPGPGTGGGGGGGDPYAALLKALTGLGDYAAGNINSSMDSLASTLQAQTNPFADFKAQQTQTTPELSQLLQSQGVSQDPLQQFASAINAQNQGQATAFQNQADIMSKIYGANQTGSIGDVAQQRAGLLNQLQGNVFGSGAELMGKKAPDRNAIMQMILQAMKVGK